LTLEDFLLDGAQPQYADSIRGIAARWSALVPGPALARLDDANLHETLTAWLEEPGTEDSVRLQVAADLSSLAWWRGPGIPPELKARLNQVTRSILVRVADGLELAPRQLPASRLRRAHVLLVGTLLDPGHSPSGGAIDYAAALARDPKAERIEIVHAGAITPAMGAYIQERLGGFPASRGLALISTDDNPDFLAGILGRGPCTFHVWCEPVLSPVISVVSRLGPTLMFTCADEAPVQYADVYWYFQSPDYIRSLWEAQGAPETFADNYVQSLSGPCLDSPPPEPVTRSEVGLAEDAFVIATVGNRLAVEMDEAFITGIELAVRDRPHCLWMVVGGLPDYLSEACRQVLGDRFLHIPYATPLDRLLTTVDVFANPFRVGGGNSANLALGAGAAVLSLRAGDVSALIPESFVASDPEEYFRYLDFLIESPEFLAAVKAEQFQHNARMRDQDAFLANLQKMVRIAAQRYAERGNGLPLSQTVFAPPGILAAAS
jgi:hypothetical protein